MKEGSEDKGRERENEMAKQRIMKDFESRNENGLAFLYREFQNMLSRTTITECKLHCVLKYIFKYAVHFACA